MKPRADGLLGRIGLEDDLLLVLIEVEGYVRDLGRIGKVARDAVEENLDSLVLIGRAHEHGHDLLGDAALAEASDDLFVRRVALEHRLHELVVVHGGRLQQLLAVFLGLGDEMGRNLGITEVLAIVAVEIDGLHVEEVDDALELVLEPDGNREEDRVEAELFGELRLHLERVGSGTVAFVDEGEPGYVIALELAVHGYRLGLDARYGAEHEYGPVEDTQTRSTSMVKSTWPGMSMRLIV